MLEVIWTYLPQTRRPTVVLLCFAITVPVMTLSWVYVHEVLFHFIVPLERIIEKEGNQYSLVTKAFESGTEVSLLFYII